MWTSWRPTTHSSPWTTSGLRTHWTSSRSAEAADGSEGMEAAAARRVRRAAPVIPAARTQSAQPVALGLQGGISRACQIFRVWVDEENGGHTRSERLRPLIPSIRQLTQLVALAIKGPGPGPIPRAPRSKQHVLTAGFPSAGVGPPSSRHRSTKCSYDAERSLTSEDRHFVMKACAS